MVDIESDEYVENLLRIIEREKREGLDPFLRGSTLAVLGISRNPKAIELLIGFLGDDDSGIREDVAESLGEYGEEAVPFLIQALKEKDWKIQWGAAKALLDIGKPAEPFLVELLHDEDWKIQWGAAEALRKMEHHISVESSEWEGVITKQSHKYLMKFLYDEDWEIHWRALLTLGELCNPEAVDKLTSALQSGDKHVRERAARTLGKIKDRRAVEPLINALQDESKYVRIQAAYSLGKIGDERAIIPLIQLFQDRLKFPDEGKYPPYVVEAASHALSRIGEPSIGPLIEVVKDDSALLAAHYQASEALGRIGKPAAKQLITALKDASLKKGWLAIALGKTGDKKAVELLIRALKDEDREIRWRSAKVLQNLKDVRAIHPLIEALEDEDDNVAGHAAIALRDMGPPALEPLVKVFKEKKGKVRSHVTWDLGAVGNMSVVDLLIEALQDECWKVREYAIQSLGEIVKREKKKTQRGNSLVFKPDNVKDMEEQVVKSITQALKDTHPDVRCRAVRILGALHNKQVTALLTEALNDEDINVRNAAQDVLNRIKRDENHH